jgi:RNase_H superfamily
MLRENRFVDLYSVVSGSLITSEPAYSLKNLEVFYMEARTGEVKTAGGSVVAYENWRETKEPKLLEEIRDYNKIDCISTHKLRDWLITSLVQKLVQSQTERVDITSEIVRKAADAAAQRRPGVNIWADKKAHYLLIRQRGGSANWLVKTRGRTRVLGDIRERHHGYLSITKAREKAATLYGQIANGYDPRIEPVPAPTPAIGWTWAELAKRYQATSRAFGSRKQAVSATRGRVPRTTYVFASRARRSRRSNPRCSRICGRSTSSSRTA